MWNIVYSANIKVLDLIFRKEISSLRDIPAAACPNGRIVHISWILSQWLQENQRQHTAVRKDEFLKGWSYIVFTLMILNLIH